MGGNESICKSFVKFFIERNERSSEASWTSSFGWVKLRMNVAEKEYDNKIWSVLRNFYFM